MNDSFRRRLLTFAPIAVCVLLVAAATAAGGQAPKVNLSEILPETPAGEVASDRSIPSNQNSSNIPQTLAPKPATIPVAGTGGELGTHFTGLNFHNQRRDADGGNQLSVEPPDQGLCVGNGYVIEPINDILKIYNTDGSDASGGSLESLNNFFFNGEHEIDRTDPNNPIFGTFVSDPRCIYDAANGHFILTILWFDRNTATGAFEAPGEIGIAVSKTNVPTTNPGDWYISSINVTNDGHNGLAAHPGCPCYGDQPLLGQDANGVYITTNEFPINGPGFNGAQIYAIGKTALESGSAYTPVRIEGAPIADPSGGYGGNDPYSLVPANSPSSGDYSSDLGGTEYLLGALEFGKHPTQYDNRIAVWALTNTSSLNTNAPDLGITDTIVTTQVYGFPGSIVQPNGPTPLADAAKNHENLIDGGDDRMQDAVFANGKLWGAADTNVKSSNGGNQVATTYYIFSPSVSGDTNDNPTVSATVSRQGYISVAGDSVTRPGLGVNSSGHAVIGVSLIGPHDYYPSAAYATMTESAAPTSLHLVAKGTNPADGFSGYTSAALGLAAPNPGVERWGDYGGAAVDESGKIWVANEWIGGDVTFPPDLANWDTYVSEVTP